MCAQTVDIKPPVTLGDLRRRYGDRRGGDITVVTHVNDDGQTGLNASETDAPAALPLTTACGQRITADGGRGRRCPHQPIADRRSVD